MTESQMSLEARIGDLLVSKHLTLAVAESCTGGLVCHRITNVPGSSRYLEGGVVAYSYSAKERLLHVDHSTLYEHGAVSEETAREMADKARRIFGTDIGISVTGIAGPAGGLPGKPVGLVFIALSARGVSQSVSQVWPYDRAGNKAASAEATLQLLLDYLEGLGE
jgi:PncC family amidohydrolase